MNDYVYFTLKNDQKRDKSKAMSDERVGKARRKKNNFVYRSDVEI